MWLEVMPLQQDNASKMSCTKGQKSSESASGIQNSSRTIGSWQQNNQSFPVKKPRVCVRAVCSGCGHETVLEGGCFLGVSDVSWFSILDIDECVSDKAFCPYNRRCVNTFGSYYCKCHVGFELKYISGRYDCVGKKPRGFLTDVSTSVLSIS